MTGWTRDGQVKLMTRTQPSLYNAGTWLFRDPAERRCERRWVERCHQCRRWGGGGCLALGAGGGAGLVNQVSNQGSLKNPSPGVYGQGKNTKRVIDQWSYRDPSYPRPSSSPCARQFRFRALSLF